MSMLIGRIPAVEHFSCQRKLQQKRYVALPVFRNLGT